MRIPILVATSSLIRRVWYRNELELRGCEVTTVTNGIACIESAEKHRPAIVILEPILTWGGSDGVLAVMNEEPSLKSIPVIVVDVLRDAGQTYRIGAHVLAGYWRSQPTADELITAIRLTLREADTSITDFEAVIQSIPR